ncbi:MAG TPA: hypothetical protein ENJ87_01875 [Gammaproteobacteria bacterium]|nr:hypothetical protein [Gammaproteobacteria bacterium]
MINKKLVPSLIFLFIFIQPVVSMAEHSGYRGKVLKFSGDVEVVNAEGEKRTIKKTDEPLNEMDTIVTKKDARIVVQFDDGALSVLDEKSRLRVEKTSWFSYLGGKIYFTFKKVFGEPRKVKTRAATIGIRGTTFIINESEDQSGESVALKEGLLQVESTGPEFEIHKKKELDEFAQFKQQQQQAKKAVKTEFEQYKQQTRKEFIVYRKQFTLRPNRVISLSGYRVDETAMTETDEADFTSFESEAEEMIKAFRAEK